MWAKMAWIFLISVFISLILVTRSESSEKFPKKYLEVDEMPVASDIEAYVSGMERIIANRKKSINATDGSLAFGLYATTVHLTRILFDYKLSPYVPRIKKIIRDCFDVMAHYEYKDNLMGYINKAQDFLTNRQAAIVFAHSLGNFNKGVLPKRLFKNITINNFTGSMDDLSLSRENYSALLNEGFHTTYYIDVKTSDKAFAKLASYLVPSDPLSPRRPCSNSTFYKKKLFKNPSVGYNLSHRMVNILLPFLSRRCYFHSEEYDLEHIHYLCAEMYREAVYIARKGFFSRDMFMEHITLCTFMGYEEFHRRKWIHKILSWISKEGCIYENTNVFIYKYYYDKKMSGEATARSLLYEKLTNCLSHLLAVAMPAIASALRHTLYYLEPL